MAFLDETGLAELWSQVDQKFGRFATGSYTGTSAYGESNPCSLTFEFEPKLVIFQMKNNMNKVLMLPVVYICGQPAFHVVEKTMDGSQSSTLNGSTAYGNIVSVSGGTLTWYSNSSSSCQLNTGGWVYTYIAIG